MPASPLSAVIVARTTVRSADACLRPSVPLSAIAKQAACAAAISSSGLVMPPGSPIRAGNVRGRLKAPLPAFAVPLPSMIEPSQFTVTLRENVAIHNLLSLGTSLLSLSLLGELDENARDAEREPD